MIITAKNLPEQEIEIKGDQITVRNNENVGDVMAFNQEQRNCENNGFSKDREFRKIATIPNNVFFEWMRQYPEIVQGDRELRDKTLKRLLRKSENSWLKSVDGGI